MFVTFETMNNRGKKLSNLELLKNRLIYISTKYKTIPDTFRTLLRNKINDAWRFVYHYLGKNKDNPLKDDDFLNDHFSIYFNEAEVQMDIIKEYLKESRLITRDDIIQIFLLEKIFSPSVSDLNHEKINNYVDSLKRSVEVWYYLYNPTENNSLNETEKLYLERLYRLQYFQTWPFLLALYTADNISLDKKEEVLELFERIGFITVLQNYRISMAKSEKHLALAKKLLSKKATIDELIKELLDSLTDLEKRIDTKGFLSDLFSNKGFYRWEGIRFFLFEYDLDLRSKSKTVKKKINWLDYISEQEDFTSIEHIIPQKYELHWKDVLSNYKPKEKEVVINSIGNLLPLSIPKNSSLKNKSFQDKIGIENSTVGYRYGCYAENEITMFKDWTVKHIIYRGIKLLKFLERRWKINIANSDKERISILGLEFCILKENIIFDTSENIIESDNSLGCFLND